MKIIKTSFIALALAATSMTSAAYAENAVKAHSQIRQIRGKQGTDVLAHTVIGRDGPKVDLVAMRQKHLFKSAYKHSAEPSARRKKIGYRG